MNKTILKQYFTTGILATGMFFCYFTLSGKEHRFHNGEIPGRYVPESLPASTGWIDSVLNSLTLEQKIAQMIMVAAYSNNTRWNETEVTKMVKEYKVGGLVFFQGTPTRQAWLTNHYQSLATTPLLIAMDAEWGLAMRLDSTIEYPRQIMLGAVREDRLIFNMSSQIALQLKRLGVHVNFAPVADINSNPRNPVINSRSFGEDIQSVSRKALLYMMGLESNGILAVAKHFPGHGDTDVDSHEELPVLNHSKARLDSVELVPYRLLINNGISGIMAGHLHIPALDPGESVPSSLSRPVIDSLLRNDMGFNGLVFTDALGMKGITNHFKPADAAEMALNAGNDILLMPENVPGVIRHLTNLVKQGKISADEIDKRCGKVLAAKYRAGLSHYEPVVMEHLLEDLNRPEYMMLQRKLIESSLTALQNDRDILPLQRLDTLRIATVALGEKEDTVFQHTLFNYAPVDHFYLKGDSLDPVDSIFNSLKKYNLIIISIHANLANTTAPYGIVPGITELADSLFLLPNVVLDLFASPYALSNFTNTGHLSAILLSYENTSLIQDLSGQVIFGAIGTSGTIPVSVLQWKAHETGIALPESGRLKFTIPYEAGIRQDLPAKVDSMINAAMEAQVFPGCQVLVARNGKVVINKAYGTPVYKSNLSVKPTDIYDLASITKAAATTLAVMRLTDENKLDITKKLSAYLPSLNGTNVKDITIRDILLHQSGLPPGLQYYLPVLEPVFNDQALLSQQLTETHPMRIGNNQYINKFTRYKTGIIVPEGSDEYPYQVADQMFILKSWPDSLFYRIANSKVQQKKEYLYSDLGFILLGQLIDSITGMPENRYLDSVFYRGLGADRLGFMPLKRFPKAEIMPTEEDQIFRKQLIHGYVHDPGAAMLGGVSGHAGLFGNALDLAKVMQMLLNKGEYAGKRYINSATVEAFTMNPMGVSGNRRGLGFDKPEPDTTKTGPSCAGASLLSFGHSGFTGTFIWADPAFDLIYVFLSNRVYPDAGNNKLVDMNIRTDIQQAVYDAILEE